MLCVECLVLEARLGLMNVKGDVPHGIAVEQWCRHQLCARRAGAWTSIGYHKLRAGYQT